MVAVLRRLGVHVDFPMDQTCCGQPAFNSGYSHEASSLARRFLDVFDKSEYVVVPSGSCASMVKVFYPGLLQSEPSIKEQASLLSGRVYEFSQFLVHVLGVTDVGAAFQGRVTYHDSCHLLRELGVDWEPRELIQKVQGVEVVPLSNSNVCCGFGGAFSVKYPEISAAMLADKLELIKQSGADIVVANDSGCLMHLAGGIRREKLPIKTMHLAELLTQKTGA
jgi:L-lactate dehydrogenase complex protein LldE